MREMVLKNMCSKDKRFTETLIAETYEHLGFSCVLERRVIVKIADVLEFRSASQAEDFLRHNPREDAQPQTYLARFIDTPRGREEQLYKMVGNQYILSNARIYIIKISCSFRKFIKEAPLP